MHWKTNGTVAIDDEITPNMKEFEGQLGKLTLEIQASILKIFKIEGVQE
jgi:hypothetical protein